MNTTEIQQKDIAAIIATGATLKPELLLDGDKWTVALVSDTTRFELVTQKGHIRKFSDVRTAIAILRDAGFQRGRTTLEI